MKIVEILASPPPFDEPLRPRTEEELARWLVWQQFRLRGTGILIRFFRELMDSESNTSLIQRCEKWGLEE